MSSVDAFSLEKATPVMRQWHSCKQQAGSALLLFRLGDFYEAFYDDAQLLAKQLELVLTERQGIPMSGIPVHTCDSYIDKLVSKGLRVAIAEQTEEAHQAKGLVKREVTRIVTAGTVTSSSQLIEATSNNFIAALSQVGSLFGLALLDITTAQFYAMELDSLKGLQDELYRWSPSELIFSERFAQNHPYLLQPWKEGNLASCHSYGSWHFDHQQAHDLLIQQFAVTSLDGFGLSGKVAAINAAGALLSYLRQVLRSDLTAIKGIKSLATSGYLAIDRATQHHLQLVEGKGHRRAEEPTLFSSINKTKTSMGARLLKRWLLHPLLDPTEINGRLDGVEWLYCRRQLLTDLRDKLSPLGDLERLLMRIATYQASPRDLLALRRSLRAVNQLLQLLQTVEGPLSLQLMQTRSLLEQLPDLATPLEEALLEELPAKLGEAPLFRPGYCLELDELRQLGADGQQWLIDYQEKLKEELSIRTLKVGYNRLSGYYIEVSRSQSDRMPLTFQRRQTLTNGERFISPELKAFEQKVLSAEERISSIEKALFRQLVEQVALQIEPLQQASATLALVDVTCCLAHIARLHNYCRPIVDSSPLLKIVQGRHPIVEQSASCSSFTPNDTQFDGEEQRLLLLTGPNMGGKSTYLRQVALIVLLAQMGSFVPAELAHIGIVDKIFTRIGASDDLSRGQSTFMVEMSETANILHNATSSSLVLLDEIGRGTSTYDGISIAWAVAEYLLLKVRPKTLFATHYWEMTKLEGTIPGAINYSVAVHEARGELHFLYRLVRGGADKSYGIQVGRLAGLPTSVIERAHELLEELEKPSEGRRGFAPARSKRSPPGQVAEYQLTFFGQNDH